MNCPRDGGALTQQRYEESIQVDACGRCGGVWLDEGELAAIEASTERDYSKELERMDELAGETPKHAGIAKCPKCGAEMAAREYAHSSRIVIDVCPEGHGVWLDGGELKALEVFFEASKKRANSEDEPLWIARSFWVSLKGLFKK
jgi:Zn-finger nucleic acid-binding protein